VSGTGVRVICPQCATPFAAELSPGGLCPSCLLSLGLGAGADREADSFANAVGPASVSGAATARLPSRGESLDEVPPASIGPYRLVRLLGEGGMGSVYLAEQTGPLERQVAVKVIKLGMDTREVVARFEAERQVLALMSHPCIAKVLEAGSTERGRPYFVMELVDGPRLTEYCDRKRSDVHERLELFLRVCGAVQHAHQKGIIHRDIKPSNVLVEERDGEPTPKVIDFGVAKATGPGLPEHTLLTRRGAWIGTPVYMSPEAASGGTFEVDSRTDIYALGVLLYELLAGALPFDPTRFDGATEEEVRHILREEEPLPPSQRLADSGETADEVARCRRTDPAALRRRLRGDLDWIVLRALEKDRSRRYSSVSELSADLRRHLQNRPVTAGPPGVVYRLGKLVRRHKLAVTAAVLVVFALLLGIVGTSLGLLRARTAERTARQQARTAEEVSDFLVGLFEVSDPGEARGNTITAREILDDGAERIDEELQGEPGVRARLLRTMGTVYRKLGLYDEASSLLEDSVEIQETRSDGDPAELARSLRDLGTLEVELGRFDQARVLLERSLETLRGAPGVDEAGLATTLKELAVLDYRKGALDRAESLYRESMELARRVLGPEDPLVAWDLNDLGNIARDRGDYPEAEELFMRSLAIHEMVYGPDHPYVANNLNNLANSYQYRGLYERALPLRERAQAIYRKVLGPDHRLSAMGLTNQAVLHQRLGHYGRAEELFRTALEDRERVLGPDHPDVAVSLYQLANLYRDQGLYERAGPLYRRAMKVGERAFGAHHRRMGAILQNVAAFYRASGDVTRAETLLRRALSIFDETERPGSSLRGAALSDLAGVLVRQEELDEAEGLYQRALRIQRALVERQVENRQAREELAASLVGFGRLRSLRGDDDGARQAWNEATELMEPVVGSSEAVDFRNVYATALLELGRTEEARPIVEGLLATGWRDPDLLRLGGRRGLI